MPPNRLRRNFHSSRLSLRTVSRHTDGRLPSASGTPPLRNDAAVSPKSDPSNSITVREPSHPPLSMSDTLTVTLPVPPSINHQYATVNGRRLLSSAGRAYKTQVRQQVWLAFIQSPARRSFQNRLRSEPLALSIRFFFASSLRRDLDGGLKIAQDAVCEGLGVNDNRIVETHLYKHVDKTNPRIEVSLSFIVTQPDGLP